MTTANEILEELKPLGTDSYKRVMFNHGVTEPFYGVKIGDMQKIVRRIKMDYQLALDLYETGVYDAMYLAGLIADDARMTKADLENWVAKAYCRGLTSATVAWVAAGSPHGWDLAREWIDSGRELTASAGWSTLGSIVSIKPDPDLDLGVLEELLERVERAIKNEGDLVRYYMNSFVIAVGCYVAPLSNKARAAAERIGVVVADLGNTSCQVPNAVEYISKVEKRGSIGKKRKTAKC